MLFYQDPTHNPLIGNKLRPIENGTLFNNIKCIFKDENLINLKHIDYKKRLLLKQYGKYSKTIKSINSMRLKCSECPHPDGKKTMHSLRHATSVARCSCSCSCRCKLVHVGSLWLCGPLRSPRVLPPVLLVLLASPACPPVLLVPLWIPLCVLRCPWCLLDPTVV